MVHMSEQPVPCLDFNVRYPMLQNRIVHPSLLSKYQVRPIPEIFIFILPSVSISVSGNGTETIKSFDDYIDSYRDAVPPPPLPIDTNSTNTANPAARGNKADRIKENSDPSNRTLRRVPSRSASSSSHTPGSGSKPKHKRSNTVGINSRTTSPREEEEGYVSGDLDDSPVTYTVVKIRVKVGRTLIRLYGISFIGYSYSTGTLSR
jgi:hypothetical protein